MKLHKKVLCSAGVALLLSSINLCAAEQSGRDILNKAYQYVGSMDKYAFTAIVSDKDAKKPFKQTVSVEIDRANKFRVDNKGTVKNRTNYFDNGSFTMLDHDFSYYGQIKTPKTIDGALDFLFDKFGINAPLSQLMYSDMDKRAKLKHVKYFGVKDVAGVPCDYIAFKSGSRVIHVWVERGDKPLVKAYSIIETDMHQTSRIDTSITWNKNPNISDSDFVFVAPKGSSKISVNPAN